MAGFGSLGGRAGGFGASFPSRSGTPNSQVVDYLRPQDEWQSDFDARYAAEKSRARAPSFAPSQFDASQPGYYETPGKTLPPANPNAGLFAGDALLPPIPTRQQAPSRISIDSFTPQSGQYDPGYTPDFTALNAERDQMMGRYDAQARNQQAYDIMGGGGQINGILGPNYSDPNFGQIVGAQPQGPSQEEMAWADGLYNPTGTYGTAPARNGGWSFW